MVQQFNDVDIEKLHHTPGLVYGRELINDLTDNIGPSALNADGVNRRYRKVIGCRREIADHIRGEPGAIQLNGLVQRASAGSVVNPVATQVR